MSQDSEDNQSKTFPPLLERKLLLVDSNIGTKADLSILIGTPYWLADSEDAACPVAIEGLTGRVQDIHGIDPMQAMELALEFVKGMLSSLSDGKQITWLDGEPYDL